MTAALCHMHLTAATYAGDIDGPRTPSSHGASSTNCRKAGMWVLLDEGRREGRAAQARADEERAAPIRRR